MHIAIDTETELITRESPLPRLVCLSYATPGEADLVKYDDAVDVLRIAAETSDTIVTHHGSYDFGVLAMHDAETLPLIFGLYEAGKVRDTLIRESLMRIEKGIETREPLSLEALARKHLGIQLDKGEDGWRLRYGELRDVPLESWPERARSYATADAATTLKVFLRQKDMPDEVLQTRADFSLKLMSAQGIRTDPDAVDAFELDLLERASLHTQVLLDAGILRSDKSLDTKKTRDMVEAILGPRTPRTDPSTKFPRGQVKYDEDTLRMTDDPALIARAEYAHLGKLLDTYIPVLRGGVEHPIHCQFKVLGVEQDGATAKNVVDTGRTSASKPNLQNLPREEGARECFVPNPGNVFVTCDFHVAELRALAQVCYTWFGVSALRDALIAGRDPHLMLAAQMRGIAFDDALALFKAKDPDIKFDRQIAKSANFGLAGGLGPDSFVAYARGQGIVISRDRAVEIRDAWKATWVEIKPYFSLMSQVTGDFGDKRLEQFGSGRVRGGVGFTQGANTMFQGLVADIAKDALWEITRRSYLGIGALAHFTPTLFLHDEIFGEAPEETAHDVAVELEAVMTETMAKWLPDVPALADAHLMRRWSKKAEAARDRNGRFIPWEDRAQ